MKNFIFIIGIEGSGTTMFSRILGRLEHVEVILGNFKTLENKSANYQDCINKIEEYNAQFWNKTADISTHYYYKKKFVESISKLISLKELDSNKALVLKRSCPFYEGNNYKPDILDIIEIFPEVKLLVFIREPKASSFSTVRRKFKSDIRSSAIVCDEHLTFLASQLINVDPNIYRIIDYTSFCQNPTYYSELLANYLHVDVNALRNSTLEEGIDDTKNEQWRSKLNIKEKEFLDFFFCSSRVKKYNFLFENKIK